MDPTCVFNFFTFFERILYKSNCIIFIFSWRATHTKIRSTLVVIVTAGSQKITLWGTQRTPLGILRVNLGARGRRVLNITPWRFSHRTPWKAGWFPDRIWPIYKTEKSLTPTGISTPDISARIPVTISTKLSRLLLREKKFIITAQKATCHVCISANVVWKTKQVVED